MKPSRDSVHVYFLRPMFYVQYCMPADGCLMYASRRVLLSNQTPSALPARRFTWTHTPSPHSH